MKKESLNTHSTSLEIQMVSSSCEIVPTTAVFAALSVILIVGKLRLLFDINGQMHSKRYSFERRQIELFCYYE